MNTSTRRALCLLTILLQFIVAGLACHGRGSANERRYDLKGKVIAVDKLSRTATLAHEDIVGYMPAMTMSFHVKNDADLEMMKPGNLITGDLVVDGSSTWIEVATVTDSAPNDPNIDVPGEPKRGDEVPDFGLVNQDGQRIHLAQYRGKALVLTFVYTRCPLPDYCPLMSENFHQIDQELAKDPKIYTKNHLLSISFDADYDTPKVLRSYGAAHTGRYSDEKFEHWEFASGTPDEVKGIAQYFGLQYYHDTQSGKDQVIHSLRTAVITPEGKLFKMYRGNEWKPAEIVADLRALGAK